MQQEPTRFLVNRFGNPSMGNGNEVESAELTVKQLTAFGLILFELVEVLESAYVNQLNDSPPANLVYEAAEVLTELIEDIVIEEFIHNGIIIPVPRLNVDVSYEDGKELEQLEKLEGIIDKIGATLPAPFALRTSTIREKIHITRLWMLEMLRPSIREESEPQDPWAFLEETL